MAEPIEKLFGLRTRVGPRNHALDGGGGFRSPMGKGNFKGKGVANRKIRDTVWARVRVSTVRFRVSRFTVSRVMVIVGLDIGLVGIGLVDFWNSRAFK